VDESTGIETFSLADWSVEKATSLYEEFDKIEKVPSIIEGAASSAILEALSPWLQEFGRLGARGKSVIDCISYFKNQQVDKFWISDRSELHHHLYGTEDIQLQQRKQVLLLRNRKPCS
jgi:hypothetical protein